MWYTVPYEGFEASDHVVYLHSCPNQHLLPLLHWTFPTYVRCGFLTGSNYIWGWETNRLACETILAAGGDVLGERYLPIGAVDVDRMIDEIRATAPDFILNSLIGPSSYAFLRAYAALGAEDARFLPDSCPILSCNLTECELSEIADVAEGLIAAGPYFRQDTCIFGSSHEAAADPAVNALADLLEHAPATPTANIGELLASRAGLISGINAKTHHEDTFRRRGARVTPKKLARTTKSAQLVKMLATKRGLPAPTRRALEQIVAGGAAKDVVVHPAKPGTHYVREWNGRTYLVEASSDGFEMDGRTWPSLSAIAKHITGTTWSGPRFFGLTRVRSAAQ